MEAKYYATCLWPGLPELWWRGQLNSLPSAIGFGLAVNLLLITRYIYPQWMAGGLVSMAFWTGIFAWIFYVVRSIRELPNLIAPRAVSEQPDQFPEARNAFLAGRWADAEALLTDVLAIEPRDPPALLLLTAVYRHTRRLDAAEILLGEISRLEVADPWRLEVATEQSRLRRAIEAREQNRRAEQEKIDKDSADLTGADGQAA